MTLSVELSMVNGDRLPQYLAIGTECLSLPLNIVSLSLLQLDDSSMDILSNFNSILLYVTGKSMTHVQLESEAYSKVG